MLRPLDDFADEIPQESIAQLFERREGEGVVNQSWLEFLAWRVITQDHERRLAALEARA